MNVIIRALLCALAALTQHQLEVAAETVSGSSFVIPLGQSNDAKLSNGAQTFNVLLDSGSSDVWFTKFNKEASPTFVEEPGTSVTLKYGSGETTIENCHDNLNLGYNAESSGMGVTLQNTAIGVSENNVKALDDYNMVGIAGLGWKSLARSHESSLLFRLADHGVKPCTFAKTRYADTARDDNPACYVGEFICNNATRLKEKCAGKMSYAEVTKKTYWIISVRKISTNGLVLCTHCETVIDTGTDAIRGPKEKIESLNEKLGFSKNVNDTYEIDCQYLNTLPDVTLQVTHSYTIQLRPEDYVDNENGVCTSKFLPSKTKGSTNRWVFGQAALDGNCVQFHPDGYVGFDKVVLINSDDPSCTT